MGVVAGTVQKLHGLNYRLVLLCIASQAGLEHSTAYFQVLAHLLFTGSRPVIKRKLTTNCIPPGQLRTWHFLNPIPQYYKRGRVLNFRVHAKKRRLQSNMTLTDLLATSVAGLTWFERIVFINNTEQY